ncbi:MAG: alkaline phosphatase family protein [Sphingomonadales bacterium]|nr:MAG: alkaline phosphatase family protein [Sphingomonadales bacterium]
MDHFVMARPRLRQLIARRILPGLLATAAMLGAGPAQAGTNKGAHQAPPKLIVAISIDQFSGDVFAEYRSRYRGGLRRLADAVVFPRGYQGHAMTETCPGHSTILTGAHPSRTGIIGNMWYDSTLQRKDKAVYCVEDPRLPGTDSKNFQVSAHTLKVPTLGAYMKQASPATRVVSVAGKDRAAILLGGPRADHTYWWGARGFDSYKGVKHVAQVDAVNAEIAKSVKAGAPAQAFPAECGAKGDAGKLLGGIAGASGFAREPGDYVRFRGSPALDNVTLQLARSLVDKMQLGRQNQTDLLAIGLSATDVIGHRYGPGGVEMCAQQYNLDRALGAFFEHLDRSGIDYLVVLTADHGGHDLAERGAQNAQPLEQRAAADLMPSEVSKIVGRATGLTGELVWAELPGGNVYFSGALTGEARRVAIETARKHYASHPQVAAVFTRSELAGGPPPKGSVDEWSLLDRARMSYDPERSGELFVMLKPYVSAVVAPGVTMSTTHGSPWDMDRRVPILFWRKGLVPFEQSLPVETVDIAPTLAGVLGLSLPAGAMDGRCLDLIAGEGDSCKPHH